MTKLPQTKGVLDFIQKYLYNTDNYKFQDGTTQAINVPYPDSGVYENYILHYPDATSSEILDINIDQLYSEVMVLTDAKIERAYEYILEERNPGNSTTNVLITVGVDDEAVFDGSATSYLHQLQNKYGFRAIAVSIGTKGSYLADLAESKDWYFAVTESNSQWVADQISRIIYNSSTFTTPKSASTSGATQSILSSTNAVPLCANPYSGKIVTVFELNAIQAEIQDIVTFVSRNLYNSANYDFSGVTQAINIPYGDTDQSAQYISQYGDAKSLADLQNNIQTLYENAVLTTNPTVSDENPDGTSGVIIVVGNHADENYGLTLLNLEALRGQGYKVIAVAVGATHGDLSGISDKPEWYFQVGDSNGQSVANQISSILCNMDNLSTSTPKTASTSGSTQSILSSTNAVPLCANAYRGKIAAVFELNAVQLEIADVVTFVSRNLYNSANYDFSGVTRAINIPYGNSDLYAQYISQYGDSKSLADLQNNIQTLYDNAVLTTNPTVSEDPDGISGVVIVVGKYADDNYGLTNLNLDTLRGQGYKFISVAVGSNHGDLSNIADKPEWYFQVGDSNGQSVSDQISYILCNL